MDLDESMVVVLDTVGQQGCNSGNEIVKAVSCLSVRTVHVTCNVGLVGVSALQNGKCMCSST